MWEKKVNLTINAFLWKKMTVRKKAKKIATYGSTKMCIPILNMDKNVGDTPKLSNPINWFYKSWSNWFYNIVRVVSFNKAYEFF